MIPAVTNFKIMVQDKVKFFFDSRGILLFWFIGMNTKLLSDTNENLMSIKLGHHFKKAD